MTGPRITRGKFNRSLILISDRGAHIPLNAEEARAAAADLIRLADEVEGKTA